MRKASILVLVALWTGSANAANTYYVATTGSDSNPGTLAQPFLTIQKAANTVAAGDTVDIFGGMYRETVTMQQSGTSDARITFQPYQNQQVTITGLDVFTNAWTPYSGKIYQTTTTGKPTQLFHNGQLVSEARYPAAGQNNPLKAAYYNATAGNATSLTDTAHIGGGANHWTGYQLTAIPNPQYRAESQTITTQAGSVLNFAAMGYAPSARIPYYITGGIKALVANRQWTFRASDGAIFLQTPGGGNPTGQTVEVRNRDAGIVFNGHSYINVTGLQLKAASISMGSAGQYGQNPSSYNRIDHCQILYPSSYGGGSGIHVSGDGHGRPVSNTIRNSEIAYSWGCGVSVYGGIDNTVRNNVIHDVNWMGAQSQCGVYILNTASTTIDHNTIYNTGRAGIEIPGTASGVTNTNYAVSYNDISRFGFLTKDTGAIYTFANDAGDATIDHNVIHDSRVSAIGGSGDTTLAGIYLDNAGTAYATSGHTVSHNVIYNVPDAVVTNKPSSNNTISSNTFWNNSRGAMFAGFSGSYSVETNNNISNSNSFLGSNVHDNLYATSDPFINSAAGDFRPNIGAIPDNIGAISSADNWTAGANFKAWTFGNQVAASLRSAVSVKHNGTKVATGNLQVGNPTTTSGVSNLYRAFIKFDLPGDAVSPGSLVSAVLRIYETSGTNDTSGGVNLYRLTSSWDPSSGSFSGLTSDSLVGSAWNPDDIELYKDIDVTPIVYAWLSDPSSNHGFSMISNSKGGKARTAKYFGGYYDVTSPQLILTCIPEPGTAVLPANGANPWALKETKTADVEWNRRELGE